MERGGGVSAVEGWWLLLEVCGLPLAVSAEVVDRVAVLPGESEMLALPATGLGLCRAVELDGRPVLLLEPELVLDVDCSDRPRGNLCVILVVQGFEVAVPVSKVAGPGGLALLEERREGEIVSGRGVFEDYEVSILDAGALMLKVRAAMESGRSYGR